LLPLSDPSTNRSRKTPDSRAQRQTLTRHRWHQACGYMPDPCLANKVPD